MKLNMKIILSNKAQGVKLFIGVLIMLSIALTILSFSKTGISVFSKGADQLVSSSINRCPDNFKIEDVSEYMSMYIQDDAIKSPILSLDYFEKYLVCKNKENIFSGDKIEKYEPEIIACASLAYDEYIKILDEKLKKIGDDSSAEIDKKYYEELRDDYKRRKKLFNTIFVVASSSVVCKYDGKFDSETVKKTHTICSLLKFKTKNSNTDGTLWGYENGASCKIDVCSDKYYNIEYKDEVESQDREPTCTIAPYCKWDDSDSDGDGWGYESDRSCKILPKCGEHVYNPDIGAPMWSYNEGGDICKAITTKDIVSDKGNSEKGTTLVSCTHKYYDPLNAPIDFVSIDPFNHDKPCLVGPFCANGKESDDNDDGWGFEDGHSCKVIPSCDPPNEDVTAHFSNFQAPDMTPCMY